MKYRTNQKNGDELSILGYGCMRFTRKGTGIDQEKAESELKAAMDLGVNYFDTAYIYPGSEVSLGKFIKKYNCREKMKIATKLPHYFLKKQGDMDRYFSEQLERLGTDYIDYYLMHMLADIATWNKLVDMGVKDWLLQKKSEGVIRNIGFSYHGDSGNFIKIIDAFDWDFAQIQFNYMDEHTQAGIEGLDYAHKKGIPVIIMEPLRGGRLANKMPDEALKIIENREPKRSPADWAFRWLWNHEQVNVVLSGMNDMAQIEENCRVASEADAGVLTQDDLEFYACLVNAIRSNVKVGCTGCGYCQPCPKGVAIPSIFAFYNESYSSGYFNALKSYAMTTAVRKNKSCASLCVGCGKCEQHCPQGIKIRDELKNVQKRFEGPLFKVGIKIVNSVLKP